MGDARRRRVISRTGMQPDFQVKDVGVIPATEEGGYPLLVWIARQSDENAPTGFGKKVLGVPAAEL